MILLSLLTWLSWIAAFRRMGLDWLDAAVSALVAWGVAVSVVTEGESLIGALSPMASVVVWSGAALLGFVVARRASLQSAPADREDGGWKSVREGWPVALLLGLVLAVALLSAPNSYDGLTYHLVRVERWIQQHSLRPFATFNTRQLFMPSWSEYAILQFELLAGGDRFANVVQWIGLAGACGGAAMLARALGGRDRSGVHAAILVATLPMAVAEASGTQTDVVAACWAVIACAFGYRLLAGSRRPGDAALCGAAFGLAVATKQTAPLFAGVALLPVGVALLRRGEWRIAGELVIAVALGTAVLAGPQLARNVAVFGGPGGDRVWRDDAAMQVHAPNQVAANVLRNLSLHAGLPSAPLDAAVSGAVAGASRAMGANPDDPRTTWNPAYIPTPWSTHEESAPNPLQLVLILGCIVALAWSRPRGVQRWFALMLVTGFVLFCAALKWQSYNSRLHTPFFVLAMAWVAVRLDRLPAWAWRGLAIVATLAVLPGALMNYTRPLIAPPGNGIAPRPSIVTTPRDLTYFMYEPLLARPYMDVARRIAASGCNDVGTHTWPDAWEYPVMKLAHDAGSAAVFRPIGVTNASARFEDRRLGAPCLLLQIWPRAGTPPAWATGWRLVVHWDLGPGRTGIALFVPAGAGMVK